MKMKDLLSKLSITLLILFVVSGSAIAQDGNVAIPANAVKPKKDWKDRIFFGGGLGASFGNNNTYVEVSPLVGYRITERLSAGIGVSYIYSNRKINVDVFSSGGQYLGTNTVTLETNNYGGRTFARYFVTDDIFLHSEFEVLNSEIIDDVDIDRITTTRDNIPALFVGGGYAQRMGGNSALFIMALWDIIEDRNTPYENPIIRVGVNVGL